MGWLKGLFGKKQGTAEASAIDDMEARATAMLAETEQILRESSATLDELNSCTPEEQAWVEWFTGLPENHKKIVEKCGEKGIKATPENFSGILAALSTG